MQVGTPMPGQAVAPAPSMSQAAPAPEAEPLSGFLQLTFCFVQIFDSIQEHYAFELGPFVRTWAQATQMHATSNICICQER